MLFNSSTFVVFLLLMLTAYWATSSLLLRRALLIAGSLLFYAWWDYRFVALLGYVTLVAYLAAKAVARFPQHGRKLVALTLLLQLGQLAIFKYATFALTAWADLSRLVGSSFQPPAWDWTLPIGVSFYTFHGISYVVDVYRGKLKEPQSLSVVTLYIVFFPQLVAGPIVRADSFIPQALCPPKLSSRDAIAALKLITMGLVYKGVFADRLAPLVDDIFKAPSRFDNVTLASAALGFYSQIYFDFVGYSTMAIGISRLFGFTLPRNFDFPYRSASITEFWRRWHISLSTWLRDYLYIPLGGGRSGTLAQYRNLLITMLLGGLWHGASYNFVLWGAVHGLLLVLHKLFRSRFPVAFETGPLRYAWWPLAWFATQLCVLLAWVPFRAQSLPDTLTILHALTFARPDVGLRAQALPLALLLLPIVTDQLLVQNPRLPALYWPRRPVLVLVVLGGCFALVLPLLELQVQSFIYFQF
jgi:D-alanyl-lipoteichoic acid acyltransferase DltB (MBOAT superfamily)